MPLDMDPIAQRHELQGPQQFLAEVLHRGALCHNLIVRAVRRSGDAN
jgi:hypothetical protein